MLACSVLGLEHFSTTMKQTVESCLNSTVQYREKSKNAAACELPVCKSKKIHKKHFARTTSTTFLVFFYIQMTPEHMATKPVPNKPEKPEWNFRM